MWVANVMDHHDRSSNQGTNDQDMSTLHKLIGEELCPAENACAMMLPKVYLLTGPTVCSA